MKYSLFNLLTGIIIIFTAGLSCAKEFSCESCLIKNKPPVAIAGADQVIVLPTDSVLLEGKASYDQDGKIKTWHWSKVAGPASFDIRALDSARSVAGKLVQGSYEFELMVTDNQGAGAMDTLQITVITAGSQNLPPVACSGDDQIISLPVNLANLDGICSSDPDKNIVSYHWTKISGPSSYSITNPNAVQTQANNLSEGTFLFQLKVTDAGGLFSLDTLQVIVNKQTDNLPVDIYVTGMDSVGDPVYWKNGAGYPTSNYWSFATGVAFFGNDVFVAGYEDETNGNNRFVVKYWKNGQEYLFTVPTGGWAKSILLVPH